MVLIYLEGLWCLIMVSDIPMLLHFFSESLILMDWLLEIIFRDFKALRNFCNHEAKSEYVKKIVSSSQFQLDKETFLKDIFGVVFEEFKSPVLSYTQE